MRKIIFYLTFKLISYWILKKKKKRKKEKKKKKLISYFWVLLVVLSCVDLDSWLMSSWNRVCDNREMSVSNSLHKRIITKKRQKFGKEREKKGSFNWLVIKRGLWCWTFWTWKNGVFVLEINRGREFLVRSYLLKTGWLCFL